MNSATIKQLLSEMTRNDLKATATALNVPRGKSKENTIDNLAGAIANGQARLSVTVTIKPPYADPQNPNPFMPAIFSGKQYSYKDSKVMTSPAAPADSN